MKTIAPLLAGVMVVILSAAAGEEAGADVLELAHEFAVARLDAPKSACVGDQSHLCLDSSRFRVSSAWTTSATISGVGNAAALTDDTGYFWFFDSANVEVVVKIVDGCS